MMSHFEIKDSCRANFNIYLHEILTYIPELIEPKILDIGCGSGVSTIELAKITNGEITAIDSNKESLEILEAKIKLNNFESRISVVHNSIFKVEIPKNHFDLIIAEGIFNIVGFKKGFRYFSEHLKEKGIFIIHDEYANKEEKLKLFKAHHFNLLNSIFLDEKIWEELYVTCLEKKISELKIQHPEIKNFNQIFKTELAEIKMFTKTPEIFKSICYIIQKQ